MFGLFWQCFVWNFLSRHVSIVAYFCYIAANSSKGITSTNEELKSMQGHIKTARSLLTKYARKENTHKLFIFLAVVFFLATVLYIMKKRLWSAGDTYNIPQQHNNEPVTV